MPPQWELIDQLLAEPLDELRQDVREELARRAGERRQTPIDREAPPQRYADPVRRYYESLGAGL